MQWYYAILLVAAINNKFIMSFRMLEVYFERNHTGTTGEIEAFVKLYLYSNFLV
jgi:hypothetical protein